MADEAKDLKEFRELLEECARAEGELEELAGRIRAGAKAAAALEALAADLQREAADCEFEPLTPAARAHLDGVLLQRVGYAARKAREAQEVLRQLGQGIRDLRGDCVKTLELARVPAQT